MKRAWLLLRVDVDGNDAHDIIAAQTSMLQKYCDLNGYSIEKQTTVFGPSSQVKPAIEKALEENIMVDILVAVKPSRISRHLSDLIEVRDLLKMHNIEMDFVTNKEDFLNLDATSRLVYQLGELYKSEQEELAVVKHPDSDHLDRYYDCVLDILQEVDYARLDDSCNGNSPEYAIEVLFRLHEAFQEFYGCGVLHMYDYEYVLVPAVIRGIETGHIGLALLTLDLTSSGEHCGTVFLTPAGIVDDGSSDYPAKEHIIKKLYMPYQYWYAPAIDGDIHFDSENIPEDISLFFNNSI